QYWYQYITNDNDSQLKFQGHQKTSSKTTGAAISTRPVLFSPSFHIPPYRIPSQIPQYQLKTRSEVQSYVLSYQAIDSRRPPYWPLSDYRDLLRRRLCSGP